ncbi:hypothetical protein [Aurantimonas sp. VKM B-3413]|uniref:hypothetical protein n=1 Tax=Aurantimonas sp. VKM B-3413 TaxID=2779401 RepID=UPI001E4E6D69|nr:hypothetical protein [Aurantimonas sp. VKM B-3413]MCB8839933.1 hypothetical protein [Aurantimonas sp. VKM B-3413]
MQTDKRRRLLKHLTSDWGGEPLDDDGTVRILNRDGTRPVIIWCFNVQNEFPTMAAGLGPDQPLIGVRSLHLVESLGPGRFHQNLDTADEYTRIIESCPDLDLSDCVVGGNCQGAYVSFRIAENLLAKGAMVRVISMEAQPFLPLPCPVGFVFGAYSELFNPFLRGEAPEAKWRDMFEAAMVEIVPAKHGEFFTPENHPDLCAAISRLVAKVPETRVDLPPVEISLELCGQPDVLAAGGRVSMPVRVSASGGDPALLGPLNLRYAWLSVENGVFVGPDSQSVPSTLGDSEPMVASFDVPLDAGEWDLHFYLSREDGGPVSWHINRAPKVSAVVVREGDMVATN